MIPGCVAWNHFALGACSHSANPQIPLLLCNS